MTTELHIAYYAYHSIMVSIFFDHAVFFCFVRVCVLLGAGLLLVLGRDLGLTLLLPEAEPLGKCHIPSCIL